jgi:hypothetical protein
MRAFRWRIDRAQFPIFCAIAIYGVLLVFLSGARPFWLDEILQLIITRDYSGQGFLQQVRATPGGGPLGYILQHWTIAVLNYSAFSARFPSELCSVLSCITLIALAGRLGLRNRWILVLLWMLLPLQLRYALEARPYSQGIFAPRSRQFASSI